MAGLLTELSLAVLLLSPGQQSSRTVAFIRLFDQPAWSADAMGASRLVDLDSHQNWTRRVGRALASGRASEAMNILESTRPSATERLTWAYTIANVARLQRRLGEVRNRKIKHPEDRLAQAFAQLLRARPSLMDRSPSALAAQRLSAADEAALLHLMQTTEANATEVAAKASAMIAANQHLMARELLYKWNESRRGSSVTHLMDAMLQGVSIAQVQPPRRLWPWEVKDTLRRDQLLAHIERARPNWAPALGFQVGFVPYSSTATLRTDVRTYLATADALERSTMRFAAAREVATGLGM